MRRLGPVFGLFFLAPFVGGFLLGNLTLADPWLGLLLAPLYGSGSAAVTALGVGPVAMDRRRDRACPDQRLVGTGGPGDGRLV
jgi:hypothetical protein